MERAMFMAGGVISIVALMIEIEEAASWHVVDNTCLTDDYVGGDDDDVQLDHGKCCMKAQKSSCALADAFRCGNAPLSCIEGTFVYEKCAKDESKWAKCEDTGKESDRCGTDVVSFHPKRCTATGQTWTWACFPFFWDIGQARCAWSTTTSTSTSFYNTCATGSVLCYEQPDSTCD